MILNNVYKINIKKSDINKSNTSMTVVYYSNHTMIIVTMTVVVYDRIMNVVTTV